MTPQANDAPGLGLVTRDRVPEVSDQELRRRLGAVYRLLLGLGDTVGSKQPQLTDEPQPGTELKRPPLTEPDGDMVAAYSAAEVPFSSVCSVVVRSRSDAGSI
jgi:hypothetical protein